MAELDWLTARPIAHRGLHDAARGIIENTASAFAAAIEAGYGIETDVQASRDGDAMVHHDAVLGRLTEGSGPLAARTAAELARVPYRATADRMMTLGELCERIGGRVALTVEIKSAFDRDARLLARVADVLTDYAGPAAAMSFDPRVVAGLRRLVPSLPRGIVAERHYKAPEWQYLNEWQRASMAHLLHAPITRPDFVAYRVDDLPAPATRLARRFGCRYRPGWRARPNSKSGQQAWADQMILKGFRA
jgi:glycerophosphoryl diester phosphodiesterase